MAWERDGGGIRGSLLEIQRAAAAAAARRFQGTAGVREPRTMDNNNFARHHKQNGCPGIDDPTMILLAVESLRRATIGCRLYKGRLEESAKLHNSPCRNNSMVCQMLTSCLVDMRDALEELLPHLTYARAVLSTAPSEISVSVMEAAPLLTDLLSLHDAKVVEHVSICLTGIAEAFAASQEKLDELCNYGLVAQAASLLSVSNSSGLKSGIIRLLSICASGSPLAAKTLLLHGISGTLKDIISDSFLAAGTTVSPTLTRPADQMHETVSLADLLLPSLPAGTISVPGSSIRRPASIKQGESGSIDIEVSGQEKLLRDQPELLQKFGIDILPAMTQVYGSRVNGPIRHKCLSVIAKLMYFSSPEMMEFLLGTTNISSFLAGILSWKDPQVLIPALQIAKIYAEKLPGTFSKMFVRERVVNAIESLLCLEISSPMLSQVFPRKRPVSSSAKSVRTPSSDRVVAKDNVGTGKSGPSTKNNDGEVHEQENDTISAEKGEGVFDNKQEHANSTDDMVRLENNSAKEAAAENKVRDINNVAGTGVGDIGSLGNNSMDSSMIFINNGNSTLRLDVKLDKPSKYMMEDYEKRLNGKHRDFYFAYNSRIIDPKRTLSSYGILNGCKIVVNNRRRGGKLSFLEYLAAHKADFSDIQRLPDGNLSLKLTPAGCRFTSSLLSCFTSTWSKRKSWGGRYDWDTHFRIDNGVVTIIEKAKGGLRSTCMEDDIRPLLDLLDHVFYNKDIRLRDNRPPYFNHLISTLKEMKSAVLTDVDRLILSSHVCAMECYDRLMLAITLRRKFKGLGKEEKKLWDQAISKAISKLLFTEGLLEMPVFAELSSEAQKKGDSYEERPKVYFRLTRDYGVHCLEHRWNGELQKFADDDGVELMIPMHIPNFLARLVEELIIAKIDISRELSRAVVRCSECTMAHPAVAVRVDTRYLPTWMKNLGAADLEKLMQTRTHTYIAANQRITGTSKSEHPSALDKGKAPQTTGISSREPSNAWNTGRAMGVAISGANTVSPVTISKNTQGAQTSNPPKKQGNVWKLQEDTVGRSPGTASSAAGNATSSGANTVSPVTTSKNTQGAQTSNPKKQGNVWKLREDTVGRSPGTASSAAGNATSSGAAKTPGAAKNPKNEKLDWASYRSS